MYYDLLAKIKNAERAKKDALLTPFSKFDYAVAKILLQGDYVGDVQKKTIGRKDFIEIKLARGKKSNVVSDYKIISKPSRRIYVKHQDLRPVKRGYGLAVVSTSKGVMSGKEAKKAKVGGSIYLNYGEPIQNYELPESTKINFIDSDKFVGWDRINNV